MPEREETTHGELSPVAELQLARVQWRAQQMRLEDEMAALQNAKRTFDAAYERAMAQWERTAECTRRWRNAAVAASDASSAGRGREAR
jgi:hypothetical protein